ncbi:hypothetical protein SAMN02746098_01392 [Desulfosporosinus lacus DSM 15449]|uniref:Uncharacterized protein n=1 Tax=Desulfosporosinus lacus DSM 15449 TaxID=1121420 RepID=A0A1M5VLW3_9FIRM|nr:hypothetical protein SAMN02746098_01392 [Desulfosporosinus lacus DSM 15449]
MQLIMKKKLRNSALVKFVNAVCCIYRVKESETERSQKPDGFITVDLWGRTIFWVTPRSSSTIIWR